MPVYFAPDIPSSVLTEALSTLGAKGPAKESAVILVVQISKTHWCVATPDNLHFTPNSRVHQKAIRDVRVTRDKGVEFLIDGKYGRTLPLSAFKHRDDWQETWRRLRKAYVLSESTPTQPIHGVEEVEAQIARITILSYDAESHSYWLKVGDSEFEWCADYPFSESSFLKELSCEFGFEGEEDLVNKFANEKNMDEKSE